MGDVMMTTTTSLLSRIAGLAILASSMFQVGFWDEGSASAESPQSFALETYVGRSYNYMNNMVDKDDLPYFNIFWTEPAEAAHDWPDFGDVTCRQLQGAVMARHMTGEAARTEKPWWKS
jgi:hypothetical protein